LVDAEGMHGRESILARAFAYTQAVRNRWALGKQNGDVMPPVMSNGANGWQEVEDRVQPAWQPCFWRP